MSNALSDVDDIDQYVKRGTTYEFTLKLLDEDEVYADPDSFRCVMSFREQPDDNLTNILDIEVIPEQVPEEEWRDPDVSELICEFVASPSETQSFPQQNVTAYCELKTVSGDVISRLFNSDLVEVDD